jgi:hypothetical protein
MLRSCSGALVIPVVVLFEISKIAKRSVKRVDCAMRKIQFGPDTHIMVGNPLCPLCAQPAEIYRRKERSDLFEGFCERCGDVCIVLSAVEETRRQKKSHLVSAVSAPRPILGECATRLIASLPQTGSLFRKAYQ